MTVTPPPLVQLVAQATDVHVDRAFQRVTLGRPVERVEKRLPGDYTTARTYQRGQQPELRGGQRNSAIGGFL